MELSLRIPLLIFMVYVALALPRLPSIDAKAEGWVMSSHVEVYEGEDLYKHIDGGAEYYLKAGFIKAEIRTFTSKSHAEPITAEVYEMKDPSGAKSVFEKHRSKDEKKLSLGEVARYYPGILEFRERRFFVRIYTYDTLDNEREIFTSIAKRIMKLLPSAATDVSDSA